MYMEEIRRRVEAVATLEITNEEHARKQLNALSKKLRATLKRNSFLKCEIDDLEGLVLEQDQRIFTYDELLLRYKNELDELREKRDFMNRCIEECRETGLAAASSDSHVYIEFDFSEIEEATKKFDQSQKIVDAGYESTFKGFLRHTEVAIKRLVGSASFQREVHVLSKLRHPNVVSLIGACPDKWITVYEYHSVGSLEDRLMWKGNSPPLSWQRRLRIASELCSALIFLHSCDIFHGNLRPANILLDKSNVAKLSDFRIPLVPTWNKVPSCITDPMGPYMHMDPEFYSTGELTSKSDIYSFGMVLLRLLTGKHPLRLKSMVKRALKNGTLKNILDSRAGDWPYVLARELAILALNCCGVGKNRPDLASDAWCVLESMRVSCPLSSSRSCIDGQCQIPNYFICPIFQEIMQNPVVAADGYTYEAEAIKRWLDGGHNTSPMTNSVLANSNLVPNYALQSDIKEWLQQK